jgi:AcrR family transcriptional regulator
LDNRSPRDRKWGERFTWSAGIIVMGIQERKEREREMRRQQILVAAMRVLSDKKGFNKSTMEHIASEAELCSGTLYQYFKNKKELYASLSLRILQDFQIRLEQVNEESDLAPEQKIDKLLEAMHENNKIMSKLLIR